MSQINLRVSNQAPPIQGSSRYVDGEYSLVVEPADTPALATVRSSIDTLTLSFRQTDKVLVALDAYTYRARWLRRALEAPVEDRYSAVECTDVFDEHGIARGGAGPVRYTVDEGGDLLLIRVADGAVDLRVRCLSCAMVGLGRDGELIEIWVDGLSPS